MSGVVVVGAGQAGAEVARLLREGGFDGDIRLIGREAFPPYERPPLSKKFLIENLGEERIYFRSRETYERSRVDLMTGCEVRALDTVAKTLALADGSTFAYDVCVLATGATARRPNIPGIALQGVHVIRTIDDALALRSALRAGVRLVVAGGGFLGLEIASSARKMGAQVVVIEGAPALMQRSISPITASAVEHRHRATGTEFLFGTTIERFNGVDQVASVATSRGDTVDADVVLVAIGADPEIALAKGAGLDCNNGVLVDAECRTSAANVYAIGDCANQHHPLYGRHVRLEAVNAALYQARCAAASILRKPQPVAKPPFFWTEQCDFRLQILGLPTPGIMCDDVRRGDDGSFSVYRFQDGILVAVETLNRPADFVRAQALIGKRDVALPAV
jgi:3-phenylpropionate/trans-cinnamate dioxygenase ferredoxin reductase subunit